MYLFISECVPCLANVIVCDFEESFSLILVCVV